MVVDGSAAAPLVDIFISYARTDQPLARALAQTLEAEGFDVWWDSEIYAGAEWESLLMGTLAAAKAIVVLWTPRSVERPWVLREAEVGLATQRLVPVLMQACDVPAQFATRQMAMMPGWNGQDAHPELERLLAGLARLAPPSRIETVRPGYDERFLGEALPAVSLPVISGVADEFRYLHFSVVMNPARRLAWFVAYNMAPRSDDVRRGDRWQPDPALPLAFQPQNEHFRGTGFDRGHLVAPTAVSWGGERPAQLANRQSFFWTNTVPQHPKMNQQWWLAVELWERRLVAARGRLSALAGPVLRDDDPPHGGAEQTIGRLRLRQNFRLPRGFWKVVVAEGSARRTGQGGRLEAAAFVWDQETLLAAPVTLPAEPARFETTLEEIERRTGLAFDASLHEAARLDIAAAADAG
jgi:endonuclease G